MDSKDAAFNGTNNKAVVTDGSGDLATATVSSTELGYLAGVTSSLQDQLDAGGSSVDLSDLNLTGKLDINADYAAVEMRKTNYGTTFKVMAGSNNALIQYGGCKQWMVPENNGNGRIKFATSAKCRPGPVEPTHPRTK